MKHVSFLAIAASSLALAGCSDQPAVQNDTAQTADMPGRNMSGSNGMAGMDMSAPVPGDSAATKGYKQSMTAMMSDAPAYTGDADVDFMQQMRIHHLAAIAMSETQLEHGSNAETRALAEQIIAEQRREIADIDRWLAARRR